MAKKRVAKRTDWKYRAEALENENAELRREVIALETVASAMRSIALIVMDHIREEVRDMVMEEVQQLDIHVS